jgi:hypothetical protein
LSYTWRDPDPLYTAKKGEVWEDSEHFVLCNDVPMQVSQNLSDALHQFRTIDIRGPLWIDAVCIDQRNLDERRTQVEMMGEIYSNAREVLIWLGNKNDFRKEDSLIATLR